MKHLNIAMILAVLSLTCVGVHGQEVTPAGKSARLRLQVVTTRPKPVIDKDSLGAETIPGGFEGGNSVKITINGKPEYHFFAHSYTVFFTGASTDNYFAGFRAVGMVRVKLVEE